MKAQILSSVVAMLAAVPAFATTYETTCSPTVCGANFPAPGPTWTTAAVNYASTVPAVVGDTIALCQNRPNGSSHGDAWTVNHAPVTSASDLTFSGTFGDPSFPC